MHHIKRIHFLIYVLFILFIAFSVGFGFAIKNKSNQIKEKDLSLSVLIDEVGAIKESVEQKETAIKEIQVQNIVLLKYIDDINKILEEELTANKEQYTKLHQSYISKEDELTNLLAAKEDVIKDLYSQNKELGNQIISKAINLNTESIIILGENAGLMDTILVATINKELGKINIISIPRDLYYNGRKINELYKKYGIDELEKAIKEITGIEATTYAAWDFSSFTTLIDELGGLKINIEKDLLDNSYPDGNGGYTTVSFKKGEQILDGESALKFARSRKSTSDFDRANRQQQIIKAVVKTIKEQDLISKIDITLKMYAKIKPNLKTNIDFFQALSLFNKYSIFEFGESLVLSTSNYLISSVNSNGQYILSPSEGNYMEIHKQVAKMTQ